MTQAQELWAIKGEECGIILCTITTNEEDSWGELRSTHERYCEEAPTKTCLYNEGYRAVRVRVEEIESDDSKGGE